MNKVIFLLLTILISFYLNAEDWTGITTETPTSAEIELISSNIHQSVIEFKVDGFYFSEVETPNGTAGIIDVESSSRMLIKGAPDLAKLSASIIIPDLAQMKLEVIASEFEILENIDVAPSKGNLTRDIDPSSVSFVYGNWYNENNFYPGKLAELRNPYIIRDYRGQTIWVYPFQYNPVTRELKVYTSITIKISENSNNGFNPLVRKGFPEKIDHDFSRIYARQFLNAGNMDYTPVEEQGNMLVISYGSFMADMQEFVDWKNTIGIPTEMVDVATIGNSAAIKSYIASYYNTYGLTYVLLVGDAAQVPSSYSSGDSDNDYSYIVGSDHYPDVFIGRFSAESPAHVKTQIQRTLEYEQTPYTGYDWYTKCIGIASSQGPGDDNEYDYQHIRNMQTDLLNYTYTYNYELFDGSQGGNDAAGNPTPSMVGSDINTGSGIILYTGHGSNTSWGSSGFSNTDVNALTNTGMLPFIWSVACVNGNFVGTTCFAEAWLRATYNNEPSGAVATLMSTINQSWNPPMEGQDEMVDILVESYANNIKRSFGGLSMNGCMKMNDTYGSGGDAMTDTWTCFGDPSVVVRTAVPQNLTVTHNPVILLGSNQFTVNCDEEGALVCLTINNQIIGKEYVSGGSATVTFDPLTSIETVTIAVTAYNHIPYLADVDIVSASGPYVSLFSYTVNDALGNNNGAPDYGEDITLHVTLENVGSAPANNVTGLLSISDPYVIITDDNQSWGTITNGTTSTQNNAFAIAIGDDIPDQYIISFDLEINGDADVTWNASINLTVNAPSLAFGNMTIDDNAGGNGNNRLDPGETADIYFPVMNNGNSASPLASSVLVSTSPYVTINMGNTALGIINAGGSSDAVFNITCDPLTPIGTSVDLEVQVNAGNYGISNTFYQNVGLVLEDWETGNFASFPWEFDGNADWTLTNVDPYEGTWSAKSGTITHNQTSELLITVQTTSDDNISFYRKVSSESSYDYLQFYIDDNMQEQWSGEVSWGEVSYFVSAGLHTFKWIYVKDGLVSSGSDCAWVDYVVFPAIVPPPDPPDIAVDLLEFDVTLSPGGSTVELLTIDNVGEETLDFTLSKFYQPTDAIEAYCSSSGGGSDEFIENVTIGDINNTTGQSYYADYTSISTFVVPGMSYPITITNGDPNWSSDQCGIWVDWNQNEDFSDDAPITVNGTPGVGPYTATIIPPVDAMPGMVRMRVQIIYAQTPDPCVASFSYGEVEDYSLNVNSNFVDWLSFSPASGSVNGGYSETIDVTFDATDLDIGDYFAELTISSNDPDEPSINVPCTLHVAYNIFLNLTVFLEGPYHSGQMNTALNNRGFIPLQQPYNTSPWFYNGTENVTSIPNANVVDWVLVELRNAPGGPETATPVTLIQTLAAFILNDGSIKVLDGVSDILMESVVSQNLFVVIRHRNHVPVMSNYPLSLNGNNYTFDFSADENNVYGGSAGQKEIETGVWGMYASDGMCDGQVNMMDKSAMWDAQAGKCGYQQADYNLDGEADNLDKTEFWFPNIGAGDMIPD